MRDVFLFPGQGSEAPRMGGSSLERPGPVRTLIERASGALGVDLAAVILRGEASLARTEVSQPATVAVSLGLALELEAAGVRPFAAAGHSVGELAAFSFAGCLQPEEAIDCVVARAREMAIAARRLPGSMAALLVSSEEEVDAALALGATVGWLELAAHNGPREWVLTGSRAALGLVASRFHTVPLPVAGPWHSQAMAEAASSWRQTLLRVQWRRPRMVLVANAAGRAVTAADDLVSLLVGQLTQPVRWVETLRTLATNKERWHVFGPGRVLRGLCRANLGIQAPVLLHDGSPEPEPSRASVGFGARP